MRLTQIAASAAAALLALACSDQATAPDAAEDAASIRVTANVSGTPIATLVVEVSAADIPTPLAFNLVADGETGIAAGTLKVPPGEARTFALIAYDTEGAITHEGSATADVRPGQNPPLQIKLGPRSGHVPVTVSFGSFSVIVTPSEALLAGAGDQVQLSVTVLDEDGQPVPGDPDVQWATTAPWSVTVDAEGLVTAVTAGAASIVATYEGVAGIAVATVGATGAVDMDGDGWNADLDCDDANKDVNPDAIEVLDGVDNDCNGVVDDTVADGLVALHGGDLMAFGPDGAIRTPQWECPGIMSPLSDPDYSPDGSRVAVAAGNGIWVVEGGGCTQLTSDPSDADPDWYPDGTLLVFSRLDESDVAVLWTMNEDGTAATPLIDGRQPAWSPDGTRLAYVAGLDRTIHVANADGSNAQRLTTTNPTSGEWDPAWSPDGSRIAFRWGCLDTASEGCSVSDFAEIYVIRSDGSGQVQLTDDASGDNLEPAWSPDGQRIAYIHVANGVESGMLQIRAADGSGVPMPFTSVPGWRHPTWAATATGP
ncbi:MAG: MopE-related protein [Gemmatimonadota bacterium]|nr:MopE-related protein [Gemmatimonadota bacterium]